MSFRLLTPDLQCVANDELHEDVNRRQCDIEHIQKWIEKQSCLNIGIDDQLIVTFLRGCKWSLQKTKDKIQCFYSIRSILPEFFENRDPFSVELQSLLNKGIFFPLPKTETPRGPRICFAKCSNIPEEINLNTLCKYFFMILDILLNEDDNFVVAGMILLADYKDIPIKMLTQATPGFVKKYLITLEKAYPLRIKNFIGINTPKIVEGLFNNIFRVLCSEKLRNKLVIVTSSNIQLVYDKVDQALFPEECGGQNGSLEELAKEWKIKVESYRNWFLEDSKKLFDHKIQFDKLKTYNEEFGMEGSFRKLIID
ncbi:hypothetical protein FQR65_LT11426 [Abscondita terminalis]|nr:hypothetical protein FQR65_LT11426 [Abscondita terminalis]